MVKGGNRLNKEKAIDVFYDGTDFTVIEEPVLEKNNTGAGCTFASSILASWCKGNLHLKLLKPLKTLFSKRFNIQTNME